MELPGMPFFKPMFGII